MEKKLITTKGPESSIISRKSFFDLLTNEEFRKNVQTLITFKTIIYPKILATLKKTTENTFIIMPKYRIKKQIEFNIKGDNNSQSKKTEQNEKSSDFEYVDLNIDPLTGEKVETEKEKSKLKSNKTDVSSNIVGLIIKQLDKYNRLNPNDTIDQEFKKKTETIQSYPLEFAQDINNLAHQLGFELTNTDASEHNPLSIESLVENLPKFNSNKPKDRNSIRTKILVHLLGTTPARHNVYKQNFLDTNTWPKGSWFLRTYIFKTSQDKVKLNKVLKKLGKSEQEQNEKINEYFVFIKDILAFIENRTLSSAS